MGGTHTSERMLEHNGMLAYMRRTTVKLPDDLDAKLRHEARAHGKTISELTRVRRSKRTSTTPQESAAAYDGRCRPQRASGHL